MPASEKRGRFGKPSQQTERQQDPEIKRLVEDLRKDTDVDWICTNKYLAVKLWEDEKTYSIIVAESVYETDMEVV